MNTKLISMVALAIAATATPRLDAQAQEALPRVAYISLNSPDNFRVESFQQGLGDLGYVDGESIAIDYYWVGGVGRLSEAVASAIESKPDLIYAMNTPVALAVMEAQRTTPVIFAGISDPVGGGIVDSVARPGGNTTGMSLMASDVAGKRLQLLQELVPDLSRVAAFLNHESGRTSLTELHTAGKVLNIEIRAVEIDGGDGNMDATIGGLKAEGVQALMFLTDITYTNNAHRIADLALRHGLPAMYDYRQLTDAGGLISYGANLQSHYRRGAHYVDRILRGANPGDLPVEQPTVFDLIINLKTAGALGITIPPKLLIQATELIE